MCITYEPRIELFGFAWRRSLYVKQVATRAWSNLSALKALARSRLEAHSVIAANDNNNWADITLGVACGEKRPFEGSRCCRQSILGRWSATLN